VRPDRSSHDGLRERHRASSLPHREGPRGRNHPASALAARSFRYWPRRADRSRITGAADAAL